MKELDKDQLIKYISNKKYVSERRAAARYFIDKNISKQNISMALDLTLHFYNVGDLLPADLIKIENFLLREKNADACYRFAINVQTNRLPEHEAIVLESCNPHYCLKMAQLKGADIQKHSQVILSANNAHMSYEFLKMLPNIDKQQHIDIIANSADPYYILLTAQRYGGAGCKKLEKALINLKEPSYSLQYAKQIANADVGSHQTVLMMYGTANQILEFAEEVKNADLNFMIRKLYDKFNKLCITDKIDEAKEYKSLLQSLMNLSEKKLQQEKE